MRLGLYGGSFDPIHWGHLMVARAALEELALDRLVFIPAAQSPFKPGTQPAPANLRARMMRLALAGETRCEVSETELQRGGVSYSIDTVREFAATNPDAELFWLIGADHVASLPLWREANALAEAVRFVVIPRPGATPPELPESFRLLALRGWPLAVSSSEIRARVVAGLSIRHLVPPGVGEVVVLENLYRTAALG